MEELGPTPVDIPAAFISQLKRTDPKLLLSLCVYGDPVGHDLHNYLVNLMVAQPGFLDWYVCMRVCVCVCVCGGVVGRVGCWVDEGD
jgi:hypothetical protein